MRPFVRTAAPLLMIAMAFNGAVSSAGGVANGLVPSDIFLFRTLGAITISPDGRLVAYVAREPDIMTDGVRTSIHIVDAATGAELRMVADADQPVWSDDGTRLAWISTAGGGSTLRIGGPDGGGSRAIGGSSEEYGNIAWSPSGRDVAFIRFVPDAEAAFAYLVAPPAGATWAPAPVVRTGIEIQRDGEAVFHPGRRQLFAMSLADGAVRRLTCGDADVSNPAWSRDGLALYFFTQEGGEFERSYLTSRMRRVALAGGAVSAVATPGLAPRAVAVSSDGRRLAFVASARSGRDYEPSGLYLMDGDGGRLHRLDAGLDREIGDPRFSADGRTVFATYADDGAMRLGGFGTGGRRGTLLHSFDGAYAVSRRGSVAYAAPSATTPAELAIRDAGGRMRVLTHLNGSLLAGRTMASKRVL